MKYIKYIKYIKYLLVCLTASFLYFQYPPSALAVDEVNNNEEKLGQVDFPVSCSAEAQAQFNKSVALLHSFWYDEAIKAFTSVTQTDIKCAMGYWGVAMSLWHPLWEPPAEADLKQGWEAVEKAKSLAPQTGREHDYIATIETYYKDWDKLDHKARALAYTRQMEQVYKRYPDDREAAVFYALALNGSASPSDKTLANQKQAGAILEKVFAEQPNHPGAAHYIIHSYDNPMLASKALVAARSYAKIAPSVPHALHMPAHIFIRLGLWQEAIASDLDSEAATEKYEARLHSGAAYFEKLHSMDYLMYAYLQGAQDKKAKEVFEQVKSFTKAQPENFASAYALAAIPARYTLERRMWAEAAKLELHPATFPWEKFRYAEANIVFARAIGAARSGNVAAAREEVETLQALKDSVVAAKLPYWADQVEIQRRAAAAWLSAAEGRNDEALKLMRSAAEMEDATDKHPVTPGYIIPNHELLGELLLKLNQPVQALKEFETALSIQPNRFWSLYGAAYAAELSGDKEKAGRYYASLVKVSEQADTERPEIKKAKEYLAVSVGKRG